MISIRKISIIAQLILLISVSAISIRADGEVDPFFNASVYNKQGSGVTVLAAQPDGKIIIGGSFTIANGAARQGLARLNTNGTLDAAFQPPDIFDATLTADNSGATVISVAFQSNGKILVGGRFNVLNSSYEKLIRLNTDGSLDTTFRNLSDLFDDTDSVNKIVVLPDDNIYIAGVFDWNSPTPVSQVAKLNADGAPIEGFQLGFAGVVKELVVQPDGKILLSDQHIERREANGSPDSSFQTAMTNGTITEIVVQPNEKILIAGTFTTVNGTSRGRIARLNSDGTLDLDFNTGGVGANTGSINAIAITSDGGIFIGGTFTQFNNFARSKLAKLFNNGTLDLLFNYDPVFPSTVIYDIEVLRRGGIFVAGDQTGGINDSVSLINADGSLDESFPANVGRTGRVREIVQQLDGKIYIGGEFTLVNDAGRKSFARLNANGSTDQSFVPYFNNVPGNQIIYAVAAQPDGKVLIGGSQGVVLTRLNADGTEDTTFNANLENSGVIYDIALLPNGQILVVGDFKQNRSLPNLKIARLNSDGTIDAGFVAASPNAGVYKVLRQFDGKILIGGDFTQVGNIGRGRIARYNSDGSLDETFNPNGGANGSVYDLDLQSNGKIVLGGAFTSLNGSTIQQRIGRLNADGSLDGGFVQTANSIVNAVKVQPDGKILIGGQFTQVQGAARNRVARLEADGTLDISFIADANFNVFDVNLQTDNKILLGGEFTEISDVSRVRVARLFNVAPPPKTMFDYDGDRRADISVYRPSTNRWYILMSSNFTVSEYTFGIEGDIVAPADFDGDGKTDIAIFRPATGEWWYLSSVDNIQKSVHWGQAGDIPRPSDFDGDGRDDFIVFRPSNNVWYRLSSVSGV
ncbi:MAG: FG-GAP-like repeat-containing protein, partial [Acidobacteriota bacterium]|nr:FG-GAP-like repeat-containing protein [Acidobacteriota bacterium]